MTAVGPTLARSSGRIGYLPGLDGLRAVSVVAVIAYHLDLSWAAGGYLGVEVFFVVSGYLITLLALDERRRTGAIDRVAFWGRRIRRLVPAVIAVILAVLAWTALVIGPGELRLFRGDAVASLLYVQNWHAIFTDQPYFVAFGRPPPLRHLWSLAIEEQFYLLWPLFLPYALRRLGRRRTIAVTAAGAVASLLLMTALADVAAPERAYYGTDTRAFGILLGCLVAFVWRPDRFRADVGPGPRRFLGLIGAGSLATLAWQFGHRSEYDPWTYPWGFALVDLCTAALIVTATHPGSPLCHRLGTRPLAYLGQRSYSLYLWHWPVIVFTRPGLDWPLQGAAAFVVRLVLIFGLAEASYRWIEQPFRQGWAQPRIGAFVRSARSAPRRGLAVAIPTVALFGLVGITVAAPSADQAVTAGPPVTIAIDDSPATTSTTASPTTTTPTTSTTPPATAAVAETPPPPAGASPTAATPPPTEAPTTVPAPPPSSTPAAPLPPSAPPPVPDVTVVGESVTVGAAPELQRIYGPRVQIDAVEGRSFNDGVAVIERLSAEGRLTPIVVVHMGNNGVVPDGALERIDAAVGPGRRLVVVNVRVPRRWEGQVNGALAHFVQTHAHSVLADWYAVSGAEPGLLAEDGVHLTPEGRRRYGELLLSSTG